MTRGSVRLRLTALFASLFLASGAGLLGITYGLVSNAITASSSPGSARAPRWTARSRLARHQPGQERSGRGRPARGQGALRQAAWPSKALARAPDSLPDPEAIAAQATQYVTATRAREDDALLLYFGIALGIMAVVAAALGWFVAGRALRPLRRITESARRISATNLHERLAIEGPDDDLRELADMIDGLFARLDASLHAQRQFVANASHELRTPLARSQTLLEVALRNPDASTESLGAACKRALAAGIEQERLIEALLILARGQRGLDRRTPLDLAAITRDVLAGHGEQIAATGLSMEVTLAPGLLGGDEALSSAPWATWPTTPCGTTCQAAPSGSPPTPRMAAHPSQSPTPAQKSRPTRSPPAPPLPARQQDGRRVPGPPAVRPRRRPRHRPVNRGGHRHRTRRHPHGDPPLERWRPERTSGFPRATKRASPRRREGGTRVSVPFPRPSLDPTTFGSGTRGSTAPSVSRGCPREALRRPLFGRRLSAGALPAHRSPHRAEVSNGTRWKRSTPSLRMGLRL